MKEYTQKKLKYQLMRGRVRKINPFTLPPNIDMSKPIIYIFFVACGTNMGDHAIVRAEIEYMQRLLGAETQIVPIHVNQTEDAINVLTPKLRSEDIIILSGGGYLGDEYVEIYLPLRRILQRFRNNKLLIFPQTIYFLDKSHEQEFVSLCLQCKQLRIFVREPKSKEIFDSLGVEAELVPDIVLTLKQQPHNQYGKILLCMRKDTERALKDEDFSMIQLITSKYGSIEMTDTVNQNKFPMSERNMQIDQMLSKFSNSSFVITDRIHGMIFSYLTHTPCVALGNYNHKVESEFEWLKGCGYITFVSNVNKQNLEIAIDKVIHCKTPKNLSFDNEFKTLKSTLEEYYGKPI